MILNPNWVLEFRAHGSTFRKWKFLLPNCNRLSTDLGVTSDSWENHRCQSRLLLLDLSPEYRPNGGLITLR